MPTYSCETCQKTFTQKGHYETHKTRKRPCKVSHTIEALIEQKVQEVLSKIQTTPSKIDKESPQVSQVYNMDYSKKSREELIAICKETGVKGYSGKKKEEIISLLSKPVVKENIIVQTPTHTPTHTPETTSNNLRMIDLFAGTGAFTHAFEQTGRVSCVFANDMVEWSKKIYDENYSHKLTLKDLNTINVEDIPAHDIMTGGFPCQPFSIAGKQEGFEDGRSNVFWKLLKIIDHHNPRCVVLENVKNLVSHDEGRTFEIIKKNLTERGYYIHTKVLDTSEITGVPQHRERI